eukprot:1007229-Pleurochrysis_carterae.AAC.1
MSGAFTHKAEDSNIGVIDGVLDPDASVSIAWMRFYYAILSTLLNAPIGDYFAASTVETAIFMIIIVVGFTMTAYFVSKAPSPNLARDRYRYCAEVGGHGFVLKDPVRKPCGAL